MNLMTKSGQTTSYKASDHVNDLVKYLGVEPNFILINNGSINTATLSSYEHYNEVKVVNDFKKDDYQIIEKDLVDVKKLKKFFRYFISKYFAP